MQNRRSSSLPPLLSFALIAAFAAGLGVASEEAPAADRGAVRADASRAPYGRWSSGPPASVDFFPIAVWLQAPRNAARYAEAGVNLYVGLWKGPTKEQLDVLRSAGMQAICAQNELGLSEGGGVIVGWMHGDEPDNAQSLGPGQGYGPPIAPERIAADYERIRSRDASRPVLLNLGQGVAWDNWHGRGVRTRHPEDYPEYVRGADIVSFDIYPVVHTHPEVSGKLEFVARGVDRLRTWTRGEKVVWSCIECTRISNVQTKPAPHQVRAEVWMAIIHGAMGIIYFVHQFQPKFVEAALLEDEEMLREVTAINRQIRELAPVLNSPTVKDAVTVKSSDEKVPIDVMVKRHDGTTYVFAVSMRDAPAKATLELKGLGEKAVAEMIGGDRKTEVQGGKFEDQFQGYEVKLYRIR